MALFNQDLHFPDIEETPNKPRNISYPKESFGKAKPVLRCFNSSWYDKWAWLHWDPASERAYFHTCISAYKQKKLKSSSADPAFISKGFRNWKDATISFSKHEDSSCHKEAVLLVITLPSTTRDVGECLSSALLKERASNRACFLTILRSIWYLARQGVALRGDRIGEVDGNMMQLVTLQNEEKGDDSLTEWLKRKSSKYTSPLIQNEILQLMALQILRQIAQQLKDVEFTIMIDETTDISVREQVVVVFRYIDSNLDAHETFVGLYCTDSITANSLVQIIKDVLLRLNLKLENCRGQCYDGASNMKGIRSGVATQISAIEPRAVYTHCYGHSFNLACQDMIRSIKVIKDALGTTFELSKLLKYSSKRNAAYLKIKEELAPSDPGFRTLCPTRWTVRGQSSGSVRTNYSVLLNSMQCFSEMAHSDMEMSSRINGIAMQLEKFDFLFGVMLGEKILTLAETLS